MSILIDRSSRIVIQVRRVWFAATHLRLMREFGTQVVAGVSPEKEVHIRMDFYLRYAV